MAFGIVAEMNRVEGALFAFGLLLLGVAWATVLCVSARRAFQKGKHQTTWIQVFVLWTLGSVIGLVWWSMG